MPDDGLRREIIAGELLVNPAPRIRHQAILLALQEELLAFFGTERAYRPLPAPVELRITPYDVVQPDLVVLPAAYVRQQGLRNFIEEPPLLVVEILSPSTASSDRRAKMALYARFGIPEYWIVDPDRPSLDAFALVGGAYVPIEGDDLGQVHSRVFPGLVVLADSLFT
jgi:Uma2 family endonuclease